MINHSNIYAHRRFGSRLGKSKLSISSASSMISLAPMDEEDILSHSLKHAGTKEDDLDFNFDQNPELQVKDEEAMSPKMREKSPQKTKEKSPEIQEKSPEITSNIKVESPVNIQENSPEKIENENPFDFKIDEELKKRNISSAKDYYDGFYDNHDEENSQSSNKTLSNNEDVLKVNVVPVTPLPSPRKSPKQDPGEQVTGSSPSKDNVIERQNSFKSTRKFFQENGTIIEPKEYKKAEVPQEPLESSSTKK